jgi:DNA polymerase-3 subunit alpha
MESTDRIAEHIDDCRRMGIEVLPPDVNASDVEFSVATDTSPTRKRGSNGKASSKSNGKDRGGEPPGSPTNGYLTFGLAAVKGVSENVVQAIVAERTANGPFKSVFDLTERIDTGILTKGSLEILIKAAALDSLGGNRAQLMAAVERAVQSAATLHRDKARGQKNLFGGDDEEDEDARCLQNTGCLLPDVPEWPTSQKLAFEKEVLGFYLTSHPLTQHAARLKKYASHSTQDLKEVKDGERPEVLVGGMISAIKKATTKKGGKYAIFDFEDDRGSVRCIIWPEQFAKYAELVKTEQIGFVQGKVEVRGSEPNLIVDRILTIDEAEQEFTQHLAIQFRRGLHTPDDMVRVRETLRRFPGKTDVVIVVDSADEAEPTRQFRYVLSTPARVACNGELRQALADAIGESCFQMHAAAAKRGGGSVGR